MNLIRFARLTLLIAGLPAVSVFADQTFNYSYTFGSGAVASGSFNGTANGNLITGISGFSLYINSVAVNGPLFLESWTSGGYVNGGAVVSIDGAANNFLFIDGDFAGGQSFTAFFGSVTDGANFAQVYRQAIGGLNSEDFVPSSWSVTTSSTVPDTASTLAMLGSAIFGLAVFRRRLAK